MDTHGVQDADGNGASAAALPTATDELRDMIQRWAEAVRNKDLDGVLLDRAPGVLFFDVPPPTQHRGIDAYKGSWPSFFQFLGDDGRFELSGLSIFAGEDVAFATALIECEGVTEDSPARHEVRLTLGFVKLEGRWQVVHEHHSLPAS